LKGKLNDTAPARLQSCLGKLSGIEIKASHTIGGKDFNGLRHLKETEPQLFQRGKVLQSGREVAPFGADLFAVPFSMWWAFDNPTA